MLVHSRRLILPLLTAAASSSVFGGPIWAAPRQGAEIDPALSPPVHAIPVSPAGQSPVGAMMLRISRSQDSVEIVVEGAGASPVLQQGLSSAGWRGLIRTSTATSLRLGPQRISLPEAGLQLVNLSGSGRDYQLQVIPVPGIPLARPLVSADGSNLVVSFNVASQAVQQTARLDLRQPGTIPQSAYAPPLQSRAVAPPLGDMATGSFLLKNRGVVEVSGPPVTMTLKGAPARDVLMTLAKLGGYGLAYVEKVVSSTSDRSTSTSGSGGSLQGQVPGYNGGNVSLNSSYQDQRKTQFDTKITQQILEPPPVTLTFNREPYARAFNTVLLVAGLQGKRDPGSNTIFVGPNVLTKTLGSRLSKIYRLNQSSADSAGNYIASLGATITLIKSVSNPQGNSSDSQKTDTANANSGGQSQSSAGQGEETRERTFGGGDGPLNGLYGTTDSRLNTITLYGEPSLILIAENYLRQLDIRQRQVALSVKILDISLGNDAATSNSFAFRYGNNFIVNDNGKLLAAFGRNLPANDSEFNAREQLNRSSNTNINSSTSQQTGFDSASTGQTATTDGQATTTGESTAGSNKNVASSVAAAGAQAVSSAYAGSRGINPGNNYPKDKFFDFVQSVITSSSTKVLASPTLILSENQEEITGGAESAPTASQSGSTFTATIGRTRANESFVTVGEQVITNYTVQAGQNGAPNTCQPDFGIAGLTFGARVTRIDDNGFVTFTLSPQIAASTRQQIIQGCGPIDILSVRRLDTGSSRVRDGQTLILTGVISDSDRQVVTKWPILGDLPLIGQFFRNSGGTRDKRELVIMVTPRVLDDNDGGTYGYGYRPATREARQLMAEPLGGGVQF